MGATLKKIHGFYYRNMLNWSAIETLEQCASFGPCNMFSLIKKKQNYLRIFLNQSFRFHVEISASFLRGVYPTQGKKIFCSPPPSPWKKSIFDEICVYFYFLKMTIFVIIFFFTQPFDCEKKIFQKKNKNYFVRKKKLTKNGLIDDKISTTRPKTKLAQHIKGNTVKSLGWERQKNNQKSHFLKCANIFRETNVKHMKNFVVPYGFCQIIVR